MKTIQKRIGENYLLNYSGIEIKGKLVRYNSERYTFICEIVDPFTKALRNQSFIASDFIDIIIKPAASPEAL